MTVQILGMPRGDSSTRWNDNCGTQSCCPALRWAPYMDGDRRWLPDGRAGRGVVGGAPAAVVPEHGRGYATSLTQWRSFLEQRGEAERWMDVGVPAVSGFLSWLRNGRSVARVLVAPEVGPSPETLEARLAAVISFYRWQEAVFGVPVAARLRRGAPRRAPGSGTAGAPGCPVGAGVVLAGAGAPQRAA